MRTASIKQLVTSVRLIEYHTALPGVLLPPVDELAPLDYVLGANGVFARGRRPGLEVCMPVSFTLRPLVGLASVASYAQWGYPKVPRGLVELMLHWARRVCEPEPSEVLFHLSFSADMSDGYCKEHLRCADGWHVECPEQEASSQHVKSLETGFDDSSERAVIEIHSHHSMPPEFSAMDNEDESQGFQVYAVLGDIFNKPAISARVGLFGNFWPYSAAEFFDLPNELTDCVGA